MKVIRRFLSTDHRNYDLVVVGNGIIGHSIMANLKSIGLLNKLKCLLIGRKHEKIDFTNYKFYETKNRVLALSPRSINFFENIGVIDDKFEPYLNKVDKINVWDSYGGRITFNDDSNLTLFTTVDEKILLYNLINQNENSFDFDTNSIDQITQDSTNVEITFEDSDPIYTKFLFVCEGADSSIRNKLKVESYTYDYKALAISANVHSSIPIPSNISFQKFGPMGILGLLPIGNNHYSLIWSAPEDLAYELVKLSSNDLIKKLNYSFSKQEMNFAKFIPKLLHGITMAIKPGFITKLSTRHIYLNFDSIIDDSIKTYPLRLILSKNYVVDRIVFIGDSAHRIHPLSGQGLNVGITDVERICELLSDMVDLSDSFSTYPMYFKNYEKSQMIRASAHASFTTILSEIYKNECTSKISSLGMDILNKNDYLKNLILKATRL